MCYVTERAATKHAGAPSSKVTSELRESRSVNAAGRKGSVASLRVWIQAPQRSSFAVAPCPRPFQMISQDSQCDEFGLGGLLIL